jgi:hypothetical protein
MSTPSGKPFDPIDPAAFSSRRVNEQTNSGQPAEDDALRSPYAPKRLRVVHPAAPAAGTDDAADAPQFLLRASRLREQSSEARPTAEPTDTPFRPHERPSAAAAAARHPVDLDDLDHPLELGRRPRPAPERGERAEPPQLPPAAAARPAVDPGDSTVGSENDIERLEASLRWLKHQGADLRQQRASKPLTPPEPRPAEAERRLPSSRMMGTAMREPKPLEPESLLAPALRRAQNGKPRNMRWIVIASLVAAPIALFAVVELTTSEPVREPKLEHKLASVEPPTVVPVALPEPRQAPRVGEPQSSDAGASSSSNTVVTKGAKAPLPAISLPAEPVAVPPPSPSAALPTPVSTPPVPAAPAPALRNLDPAETQLLIRQGEQFVAAGDMATARVVFQRAAETGDASAAMALGATYDPLVLAKLGVLGVGADVDKARNWYQKAKEFGSQDAPRRLELLANR